MVVKVSKPEINLREKISELDKPSGVAGQAMLAAETVQEQQALIGVGRKNLLINGDFKVSQRGTYTSATSTAEDGVYVDRWVVRLGSVNANIQHILGSNSTPGYPYKASNSLRLTSTTNGTATGIMRLLQRVEGFLSGRTLTFGAWVKSNSTNARLFQYQHDGGYRVSSSAHSGSGQWEFLSVTVKSAATTNNNLYFDAAIATSTFANVSITSGDYIEISEAQMEISNVATPFEYRSYAEELALCQRYFWKIIGGKPTYYAFQYHADYKFMIIPHPVEMRATPVATLSYYGGSMTTYQADKQHFKAYISSTPTDSTVHYITEGKWDAEF